jgi:hypothetical protein
LIVGVVELPVFVGCVPNAATPEYSPTQAQNFTLADTLNVKVSALGCAGTDAAPTPVTQSSTRQLVPLITCKADDPHELPLVSEIDVTVVVVFGRKTNTGIVNPVFIAPEATANDPEVPATNEPPTDPCRTIAIRSN